MITGITKIRKEPKFATYIVLTRFLLYYWLSFWYSLLLAWLSSGQARDKQFVNGDKQRFLRSFDTGGEILLNKHSCFVEPPLEPESRSQEVLLDVTASTTEL